MIKKKKRSNRRHREPFARRAGRFFSRALKVAVYAGLPLASAYGGLKVWGFISTTPHLAVKEIRVEGAIRVARDEAVELSGIKEGENIYSFSSSGVEASLAQSPWVKSARVRRTLPDVVTIEVAERKAVAFIQTDALYLVDSSGRAFKRYSNEDELDLPVITGLKNSDIESGDNALLRAALTLIGALDGRSGFGLTRVSEISADPAFGLSVVTLDEGARIEVGTGGFEEKLATLERVMRIRGGTLAGVEAIDLTGGKEVVVRFSANVVKEGGETNGQKG